MTEKRSHLFIYIIFSSIFGFLTFHQWSKYEYLVISSIIINSNDTITHNKVIHVNITHNATISFLPHLTQCIGIQKGGTTSLMRMLKQIKINVLQETHYFDHFCQSNWRSFHGALQKTSNICSIDEYVNILVKSSEHIGKKNKSIKSLYYFQKTPSLVSYPHIAYIMVNEMVTHGTKILLLLRTPHNRFISSHFQHKRAMKNGWVQSVMGMNDSIDTYLDQTFYNQSEKLSTFVGDLTILYNNYLLDNSTYIMNDMSDKYKQFVYYYISRYGIKHGGYLRSHHPLYKFYFIWIMSCYAPQMFIWMDLIQNTKFINSFKIIQSEYLFKDDLFQYNMRKIQCYIRFDAMNKQNDFEQQMKQCLNEMVDKPIFVKKIHANQATKGYQPTETESKRIRNSYEICNKWLRILIDKYPHMVLHEWDWSLWKL